MPPDGILFFLDFLFDVEFSPLVPRSTFMVEYSDLQNELEFFSDSLFFLWPDFELKFMPLNLDYYSTLGEIAASLLT